MEPDESRVSAQPPSAARSGDDKVELWEGEDEVEEVVDSSSLLIQGLVHDLNNRVTIIAHSMELAGMIDEVAQYRVICGQVAEVCERARLAMGQVNELVRHRESAARALDLCGVTREVALRVRAWMPEADLLRVSIPVAGQGRAGLMGNAHEIQELFLYLSGVLAPLESTPGRRPSLAMRMEPVETDGRAVAWAWVFETVGCDAPPLFWRALFEHQNSKDGANTPLPVHRAFRIIKKHFGRLEAVPEASALRLIWTRVETATGPVVIDMNQSVLEVKPKVSAAVKMILEGKKIAALNGSLAGLELWRGSLQSMGAMVSVFADEADFFRWLPAGSPPDMLLIDEALLCGREDFWAKALAESSSMRVVVSGEIAVKNAGDYERYGWVEVSGENSIAEWLLTVANTFVA